MMGWLKTMKSIKYLVLLAILINGSQSIHVTTTSSSIADGVTASISNSSSNNATTIRERSTKVSSERAKGKNFSHSIYIMKHTIG